MSTGFFDLGVDSVEVGVIHNRLQTALSLDLPKTLLFDFPSAAALGAHLDELRAPSATKEKSPESSKTASKAPVTISCLNYQSSATWKAMKLSWDMMTCDHLIQAGTSGSRIPQGRSFPLQSHEFRQKQTQSPT